MSPQPAVRPLPSQRHAHDARSMKVSHRHSVPFIVEGVELLRVVPFEHDCCLTCCIRLHRAQMRGVAGVATLRSRPSAHRSALTTARRSAWSTCTALAKPVIKFWRSFARKLTVRDSTQAVVSIVGAESDAITLMAPSSCQLFAVAMPWTRHSRVLDVTAAAARERTQASARVGGRGSAAASSHKRA